MPLGIASMSSWNSPGPVETLNQTLRNLASASALPYGHTRALERLHPPYAGGHRLTPRGTSAGSGLMVTSVPTSYQLSFAEHML